MRTIFFSLLFLTATMAICSEKQPNKHTSNTKNKNHQLTEREKFTQKYKAMFGEKPSNKVWNRVNKSIASDCPQCCGNGGGQGDGSSF